MFKKVLKGVTIAAVACFQINTECIAQQNATSGIRKSPVSYHLSFDNDDFFKDDIIEQSGKKDVGERKIDFPGGKFGKGIRMSQIPAPPDADNMTGIDLDLVTAVIFNTKPGNEMGYNQPFIWGGGRINARLGAIAFWAKGKLPFAGPLFEQTSIAFGRTERDLLGIVVNENNTLAAYIRDARYVRHELSSEAIWNSHRWNHIVLNWDWANGMELWLNGEKVASSWGQQFWYEADLPGLFHLPAAGLIYDELYLMDRPISESEINVLMTSNTEPQDDVVHYARKHYNIEKIAEISGAVYSDKLPTMRPSEKMLLKEVWPEDVADGHIPGWYVMDGRNEMAWPHSYAMFTIIPGDADFHAEKVDIMTSDNAKVNYITASGNLTDVGFKAFNESSRQPTDLFDVPVGDQFFYGSTINTTYGATFRVPFTEKYGTPEGFSGDIHVPLSGEKRIHNIGLYHYQHVNLDNAAVGGKKLVIKTIDAPLDTRSIFAVHSLTSRDERRIAIATSGGEKQKKVTDINIGAFARLNILSEPYLTSQGIKSITLALPIRTAKEEEALFIRVRDPAVPSRIWNQFAVRLQGFDDGFSKLVVTIDFQDIVVTGGDRLWVDLGTAGNTEIRLGNEEEAAEFYVEEIASYIAVDDYAEKEIIPANVQYSKMYEFMPWQFTGKTVSIAHPYSYGGPFDMILPALAIQRVQPDHFVANYLIRVSGPDFKDGKVLNPESTPLITVPNPYGAPEWAVYMRDFNLKRHAIANWWSKKQNPDGQLGGGWNDDVLFLSFHQPDLPLDGNENARYIIDATHVGLEATRYFKDGYCNIYPMDRMHIGDFISERYNTVINNLGQAYALERELESARWLGKPDEIPRNYYEDAFKSSVNVLNWYWGKDISQEPYQSKSLDTLAEEFRRYTSVLDDNSFYRFTASNVHRDDFSPYGANNMYTYMLGGKRGTRLDAHLKLAVTYPSGGGADVSRVVLYADNVSLAVAAYSFDERMRELAMRLCRIDNGRYQISLYEHVNGKTGSLIWQNTQNLKRFDVVQLPLPSRMSVLIKIEQLTPAKRAEQLADLAIDQWDAIFDNGTVSCVIHNIGNMAAKNIRVSLLDGDVLLQEQTITGLEAPTDFIAKRKELTFSNVHYSADLRVHIDPENSIGEILEENNQRFVLQKGDIQIGLAPK